MQRNLFLSITQVGLALQNRLREIAGSATLIMSGIILCTFLGHQPRWMPMEDPGSWKLEADARVDRHTGTNITSRDAYCGRRRVG